MQERGQSVSSGMWVALGGALIAIAAVVVLATTPAQPRAHAGVRHFSLAAVTRPSATRRVLELSGRGDFPPGVTRAGNRLLVKGSRADDTLIVDFSHGNPIPSGGLLYDGTGHETAVGNVLVIRGGHFRRDVYDFTSASAGSIQLDRTRIAYRNLQPVANTGTATDAVFNLPAGANSALLQDDATPGNNKSELFSGAHAFETTTFTNPSSSLTINGGGDGDALTVEPADSFTAANVTVGSEGSVAADSLTTTGTLRITAGSVTQPSGALAVGAVGVNTVGGIALSGASNAIGLFAGSASGAGAAVSVVSSPLSVGTVAASGSFAGASGVSTNDGDIGLSTTTGSLKLSQALTAGTAKLTATCGTGGGACAVDASGGSLNGSPVTLSSGSGPGTFDLTDDNTVGAGPLIIDGGGTGTAKLGRSSVSQSPDSGLVLRNLVSAAVTGGNFTANAKEGILVQNTAAANIGGAATGQPNVIAGNGTNGITVASGSGIQIVQNSIFANRGLGISLQNGANHGLSAPVLSAAAPSGSGTHVTGSLHGTTGHSYRIELFDNSACDPSGFTEGRTFIGSTTVAADPSGDAAFNSVVPGPSGVNDGVGATATDVATGDTSQFSSCIKPAPPSVSILAPTQGAKYKLGAVARASFSCADDSRGPGIALCLPTGINGALVDTRTAGSHTFAVTAVSSDGMSSTQSVTYTVQSPPSNRFTLSQKKLKQTTGDVSFAVAVPGAGTVSVVETMLSSGKQFVAGRARLSPRRRQTVRVAIKPNGRALRLVRHHKALVSVQLQVTFTPNGGTSHSVRFALSLSNRA
ncbi:MAG TPA: right-handed parallel beta-helix repeat-containing protein [Solirubrobacteraceae bacterium]